MNHFKIHPALDKHTDCYTTSDFVCPYFSDKLARYLYFRLPHPSGNDENLSKRLLRQGFRRWQNIHYCPICVSCQACVPLRVKVQQFNLRSKSTRRLINKNRDLSFTASPAAVSPEAYALYRRYSESRHVQQSLPNYDEYATTIEAFVPQSQLFMARYGDGSLAATILVDDGGDGLSAVTSCFDPEQPQRGLGNWLIIKLIAESRYQHKPYLYLGYWIEQAKSMQYKTKFQPAQIRVNGEWQEWRA